MIHVDDNKVTRINWPWFRFIKPRHTYGLKGVRIPRRFGRAYTEYDMDCDVFYIIPINLIVAFWRAAMLRIKWQWPEKLREYEKRVALRAREQNERLAQNEYKFGYDHGYKIGFREGRELELEMLKEFQQKLRDMNG